ncbi:MAG: phosphatase [Bacteroidota bacterium]
MKLAAIDIGSNAVRLQITKVIEYETMVTFKKIEYVRFPLRLGHDVFKTGRISEYNKERFYKLMTAFKNIIDLYEVDAFYGCATSAMRESENGQQLVDQVRDGLELSIKIISGEEEAEMINKVILSSLDDRNYIHIDVGGGSTELNLYQNHEKIHSQSFPIGTLRKIKQGRNKQSWEDMNAWVRAHTVPKGEKIIAVGTGGNINKLFELSNRETKSRNMTLEKLMRTQQILQGLTVEDLLNKLQLNPDRADVIIPASEIYISVMQCSRAKSILVPDIGLKDGINYHLYETYHPISNKVLVRN